MIFYSIRRGTAKNTFDFKFSFSLNLADTKKILCILMTYIFLLIHNDFIVHIN
jgi:hypothetical protein